VSKLWCRRFVMDGPVWVAFTVDDIRTLADKAGLRVLTGEQAERVAARLEIDASVIRDLATALTDNSDQGEFMAEAVDLERLACVLRGEAVAG